MRGNKNNLMRVGTESGNCFVSLSTDFMAKQGYTPKDTVRGELCVSTEKFNKILAAYYKEKI